MYRIALIGPGGAGKSTLAFSYSSYLNKQEGLNARVANLDPASKHVNYEPAYDVRKRFSLQKIMREHKLGPNGALKKIYLSLAEDKRFVAEINSIDCDWLLLDTAGSLELFLFEGTAKFLNKVADAVLFVTDNEYLVGKEDENLLKAINALQETKYLLPTIGVLNKMDLVNKKERQTKLKLEAGTQFVDGRLRELVKEIGRNKQVVHASAWERKGFKELTDGLRELKCECGDSS